MKNQNKKTIYCLLKTNKTKIFLLFLSNIIFLDAVKKTSVKEKKVQKIAPDLKEKFHTLYNNIMIDYNTKKSQATDKFDQIQYFFLQSYFKIGDFHIKTEVTFALEHGKDKNELSNLEVLKIFNKTKQINETLLHKYFFRRALYEKYLQTPSEFNFADTKKNILLFYQQHFDHTRKITMNDKAAKAFIKDDVFCNALKIKSEKLMLEENELEENKAEESTNNFNYKQLSGYGEDFTWIKVGSVKNPYKPDALKITKKITKNNKK